MGGVDYDYNVVASRKLNLKLRNVITSYYFAFFDDLIHLVHVSLYLLSNSLCDGLN